MSWLARGLAMLLACTPSLLAGCGAQPRVYPDAASVQPLEPGARVPSVTVRTVHGEPVDLADAVLGRGALLVFYRGGW